MMNFLYRPSEAMKKNYLPTSETFYVTIAYFSQADFNKLFYNDDAAEFLLLEEEMQNSGVENQDWKFFDYRFFPSSQWFQNNIVGNTINNKSIGLITADAETAMAIKLIFGFLDNEINSVIKRRFWVDAVDAVIATGDAQKALDDEKDNKMIYDELYSDYGFLHSYNRRIQDEVMDLITPAAKKKYKKMFEQINEFASARDWRIDKEFDVEQHERDLDDAIKLRSSTQSKLTQALKRGQGK